MLGHTPQCSGVSTQVLAECTPALAGEGRKNQSLLVPNVLERAEERRSTLRELAKVARAEGRPRPPAVRTASRKGSNDQLQIGLGCAERRRVGRDRRAARARREHRSAAGAVPLTWLCRAGQCLNDHIAGAVSTAIAATARWRASAASAGERRAPACSIMESSVAAWHNGKSSWSVVGRADDRGRRSGAGAWTEWRSRASRALARRLGLGLPVSGAGGKSAAWHKAARASEQTS